MLDSGCLVTYVWFFGVKTWFAFKFYLHTAGETNLIQGYCLTGLETFVYKTDSLLIFLGEDGLKHELLCE